ncbi:hypothetical protein [Tenacibaculum maritimum]|uniref:Uncharacterized protein n=1 Tax=Tenacibaculum maritimum NCIMB 2154 TaxID=1349785 RepID=A0A2H1E8L0_9FLAO|nr:hypothetical protein [Tenacibaculum maritimum]MCD9564327.1 hypothetical protein [Tenacibaculum maritimum]MCD9566935.1 hypothetical protein [Tenacibaculum maritimum]MCD9580045.1 hypothetical protein [Tenacibaculum maritimum]MCD9585993.1 hypothetical protein [Tenacibaculum maritimum]MCD9598075.1 hypothetical protein [Tenacibaculum maritimum]
MISIEEIQKTYSKFSDDELLKIVRDIKSLRKDVIPILQNELKERNLTIGLEKVNDFLLKEVTKNANENFEPKKFIEEELKQGYSLETIKHKLNHMDVNMFEVIGNDNRDDEFLRQFIETNKKKGIKIAEIEKDLKEKFNVPIEKTRALDEIIQKEGNKNKFIGFGLVVFSILSIFLKGGIGISTMVLFLLGMWRIVLGFNKS